MKLEIMVQLSQRYHHCQFKTIMYLTDVNEKNGYFTFIANSSKNILVIQNQEQMIIIHDIMMKQQNYQKKIENVKNMKYVVKKEQ